MLLFFPFFMEAAGSLRKKRVWTRVQALNQQKPILPEEWWPTPKVLAFQISETSFPETEMPRKKRQLENPVRLTPMRQEEKHVFQHDAWSMFCTSWSICPGSGALLVMSAIKQMPYFPLSWTVAIIIHRLASTLFSSTEAYPQALLQHPQLQ